MHFPIETEYVGGDIAPLILSSPVAGTPLTDSILTGNRLSAGHFDAYHKALQEQYPDKCTITLMLATFVRLPRGARMGFIGPGISEQTTKQQLAIFLKKNLAQKGAEIIFIPIALAADSILSEDHATLLVINKATKTLEYYDPKGASLEQEERELAALPVGKMTGQVLLEKIRMLFSEYQYHYYQAGLLVKHQKLWDGTNCGVFICWAMRTYLMGESLAAGSGFDVLKQPLASDFDIKHVRGQIVDQIRSYQAACQPRPF